MVATAGNFVRTVPFAIALSLLTVRSAHVSPIGAWLAVASGALASGAGYTVRYTALGGLTATRAATVQLSVPVLAAAGGVTFVSEPITMRLALSACLILGGVAVAVTGSVVG